jgi:hypothetical protein
MEDADLERWLRGWLDAFQRYRPEDGASPNLDLTVYLLYLAIQNALPVEGDIAELGVLHGGPFALLTTMAREREQVHAIDLFDLYNDHPDPKLRIGNDPLRFQETVARIAGAGARYRMVRADTLRDGARVREEVGRNCRFFHVDGDHLLANVRADLAIAASCVSENARPIIVVDDTFAHGNPEVTEGLLEFLHGNRQFAVFLLSKNKAYLCRKQDHELYAAFAIEFLKHDLRWSPDRIAFRHLAGEPCLVLKSEAAGQVTDFGLAAIREIVKQPRKIPRAAPI